MLLATIAIILVLGGLIFFHELGHFLMARVFGVGVKVFALGFGPRLFGMKYGKTDYRVCAIPLGGYVQLVGQEEPMAADEEDKSSDQDGNPDSQQAGELKASAETDQEDEEFAEDEFYSNKPVLQRMAIVAAGPIFNVVLAVLLYMCIFSFYGRSELLPVLGSVEAGSPAAEAGLQEGDTIISLNGQNIDTWTDLVQLIRAPGVSSLEVIYERRGRQSNTVVTPKIMTAKNIFGEEVSLPRIGIGPSEEEQRQIEVGFLESARLGAIQSWRIFVLTVEVFGRLITGSLSMDNISGPIGIAKEIGNQAHRGLAYLLSLSALISINLAILNLLPIPVLDGGHLLFLSVELIAKRPPSLRIRQIGTRVGLFLLLALMVLAIFNDIKRLIV